MSLSDVFRERRPFPGQDPWIVAHDGWYLLVQAADGNRRVVVKRFRALDHMDRNEETVIWTPPHQHEVWAPEMHNIGGHWYVYYSAGDGRPGSHRTYALVADDPRGPYQALGAVSDPRHDVWAIDLTVFAHRGRLYALWSGWDGPDDRFPQNLYVAPMSNPWTLSGERSLLSTPERDWEMSVAAVNEGPEVIRNPESGRLFVMYSADASWSGAYKIGLLEWTGGDVTSAASWRKLPRPLLTGGGHGCVVDTPAGPCLVYHRKLTAEPGWKDREICWAPLGWDAQGCPVLHPSSRGHGSPPSAAGLSAAGPVEVWPDQHVA